MAQLWALSIPVGAALIGWLLTPQSYPPELGTPPPRLTNLNASSWGSEPWPPRRRFTEAERKAFEQEGYVIIRDFLSPGILQRLRAAHGAWCPRGVFSPHWSCKNEDVWARSDVFRDFLYHGPLAASVAELLQVPGVRIYGDHVTEMRKQHQGIHYHFDNAYYGGVMGEFHQRTRGAIVFLFLTGVHANLTGGSVLLQPRGHKGACVMAAAEPWLQGPCREAFQQSARAFSFKAGDALVLHPLMPHASQPPAEAAPDNMRRMTYLARFVESDAVYCVTDAHVRESGKVDCRHDLRPGEKAHHVCYQQMHPLLGHEIQARMAPDWFSESCNIHRNWRYTFLKRMKFRAEELRSWLLFRWKGSFPRGIERAQCVYPPDELSLFS